MVFFYTSHSSLSFPTGSHAFKSDTWREMGRSNAAKAVLSSKTFVATNVGGCHTWLNEGRVEVAIEVDDLLTMSSLSVGQGSLSLSLCSQPSGRRHGLLLGDRLRERETDNRDFMAASKLQALWNHPAGPKTIHFWAPTCKWCISIANVADFSKPPEMISYPQQIAVTFTGLVWSRYSLVIKPKNWNLFSVNVAMAVTGFYQLARKARHDYFTDPEVAVAKE